MTIYYVSKTGSNTNDGSATGDAYAWKTIQYAVSRPYLEPGDTIKILAGVYNETDLKIRRSDGCVSGESGLPITLTANDTGNKPVIRSPLTTKTTQLYMLDMSWWTLDNLEFSYYYGVGIDIRAHGQDCEGVVVQNCDFVYGNWETEHTGHTVHYGTRFGYSFRYARVSDCYFDHCDPSSPTLSGNEVVTMEGNIYRSSVYANRFDHCRGICINMLGWGNQGSYYYNGQPYQCVIRGNKITNMRGRNYPPAPRGNAIYTDKANQVLIEDNIIEARTAELPIIGIKLNNEPHYLTGVTSGHFIIRNNVATCAQFALAIGSTPSPPLGPSVNNVFCCHNAAIRSTAFANTPTPPVLFAYVNGISFKNNVVHNKGTAKNNLLGRRDDSTDFEETWTIDGNLWYAAAGGGTWQDEDTDYTSWASFTAAWDTNGQNLAPVYEDEANDDYSLDALSDGYGDAIALTLAAGAGTSSTVLFVDESRWFCDGFGIQGGDKIDVGGVSAVISSIDYQSDTIYLETAISWADNAEIRYDSTNASIGITDEISSSTIGSPPTDGGGGDGPTNPGTGGTELLTDPGFDVSTFGGGAADSWNKYSAGTASWSISGGVLTVNCTATGGNTQLYQHGFSITSGRDYKLSVKVEAAASKTLQIYCIEHDTPYANLGLASTISATTTNQEYVIEWTATASSTNARIVVMFPVTSGDMDFDYVSLRDVTGVGDVPAGASGSTTLTIAAGTDDFYVGETSTFSSSQSNPRIGQETSEVTSAIYWFSLDTAIPSGATVTAATLTIHGGTGYGSTGWTITCHAEDVADASKVTSQANYAGKSWTTASVDWEPTSWGASEYEFPDISTVIQELVDDNGGLASSAGIQLRLSDLTASSGQYVIVRHYDFSSAYAASLYLQWAISTDYVPGVAIGKRIGKRLGVR